MSAKFPRGGGGANPFSAIRLFGTSKMHFSHKVPLTAVRSVAVDSMLSVTPIVGFCNCSMFCCALICVHSSFAIILMDGKERAGCFTLFVFLVSRDCYVALPHDATSLSAVFDCGMSYSYSLTIFKVVLMSYYKLNLTFVILYY